MLTRVSDGGPAIVIADDVVSADFSLNGNVLRLEMEIASGDGGTTPMILETYLRDLQP